MVETTNTETATALETTKTFTLNECGFIKAIVLVLPNFTTATEVSTLEVYDKDDHLIYTNSTAWAENTTHLITSISVPVNYGYYIKLTLDGASGGSHNITIKTYINTQE